MKYKPQSKLIKLREDMGITKTSISKKIGKTIHTYIKRETGEALFTIDEMFIIQAIFKLPMEEIFINPLQ